jgi:sialate O-acetylesterase
MTRDRLVQYPQYATTVQNVEGSIAKFHEYESWLRRFPTLKAPGPGAGGGWAGLDFRDRECSDPVLEDSTWEVMRLPTLWEQTALGQFDGVVWFRRTISVPPAWRGRQLVLELGPVDDMDVCYVNGVRVGGYEGEGYWQTPRVYTVPARLVVDTVLHLAVRVIDTQGGGGLFGQTSSMRISADSGTASVLLAGAWRFLPVAEYRSGTFYVLGAAGAPFSGRPSLSVDLSPHTPGVLFNGMISPLVPYAFQGVIWYQGESNTGQPELYTRTFPDLIAGWRTDFRNAEMPFFFVQIAPYDYGDAIASQYLREAQLRSLSVPNTGMVVTLDIGDPRNIHPANKVEVGRRLALWALAKTYGKGASPSGPVYRSMKRENSALVLAFDDHGGGLVLKVGPSGNGFQIAGDDSVFRDAVVKVRGTEVVVSHPGIREPRAVRYAFSNTSAATLFSRDGLPASSFRTDAWPRR